MTDQDRHSLCDTTVHVCTLEKGEREGRGGGEEGGGGGKGGTQSDMLHEIQRVMFIER